MQITSLNGAQRAAVEQGDGPVLVLAGAGTGKTRVIVERLAWLVSEKGVDPRNLLALTFTNRAAYEMRERVAQRLGVDRLAAWVGTFHSFGLFLLRRDLERLGRPANFTVFDDADQLSLMKRLVKDLPSMGARVSPRDALNWISRFKQRLHTPTEDDIGSGEDETYLKLWRAYHAATYNANAVDFDDLLVLPARLLSDHPEVREKYQRRYRYIHVDEYQDTNHAQFVLAQLLSAGHGNLFVVGDEDQSIYSWRGADLENILEFEQTFEGARVVRLEQNYRSTEAILNCANRVVSHNDFRLGKTLWTSEEKGGPVRVYEADDENNEAQFIVRDIGERGLPLNEVAVLFRTNGQARAIEEAFRRGGLPYVVYGGTQFYSRKEIKDILAYLRLLVNPADEVSLRRILNVPPRGIGGATLQRIEEYAAERGAGLFSVLRDVETDQTLGGRARTSITAFVHLIDDLAFQARTAGVGALVEKLLDSTGYRKYVEESDAKDFRARLEIVDEFVSSCRQYDNDTGGDLTAFLQDLALVSDTDAMDPNAPAATLLTCHAAKGLEFDHVYLAGLEEGLLPHASSIGSAEELEEERRLCYVAMTRARRTLTLAWAQTRTMYGERRKSAASRFLNEAPSDALHWIDASPKKTPRAPAPTASQADAARIQMGTRVRHAKFGQGTVMYTSGSGAKLRARIRFQTGRTREFIVSRAPLEILEGNSS